MRRLLVVCALGWVACNSDKSGSPDLLARDGASEADLAHADLAGATPDLVVLDLVGADLTGADLTSSEPDLAIAADLQNADLVAPTCLTNGLLDPGEDGVDCGGVCSAPCPAVDWGDRYQVFGLAYARDNFLYTVSALRVAIDRIDPATGRYSHYRFLPAGMEAGHITLLRSTTGTVLVRASDRIYELIPETAAMNVITAPDHGTGAAIAISGGAQVSNLVETADGTLYVAQIDSTLSNPGIVRIDRATGDRTVIASAVVGTGPWPSAYEGPRLALDTDDSLLLFATNAVVRVDRTTGNRTNLTLAGATTWPFTQMVQSVVTSGDHVDVVFRYSVFTIGTGGTTDAPILRMTTSGNTATFTNLSGATNTRTAPIWFGSGTRFVYPIATAAGPSGTTYVLDSNIAGIVRVDDATGDRTLLARADQRRGNGPAFTDPTAVSCGSDGLIYVADFPAHQNAGQKAVFVVDPATGNRSVVTSNLDGSGTYFDYYDEVVIGLLREGDTLYLALDKAGSGSRAIAVDLESSIRSVESAPPSMPAIDATKIGTDTYTVSSSAGTIVKTPMAGASTVISGAGTGTGPALRHPVSVCATSAGQLMVVDDRSGLLLAIDPTTGNRTIVSGVMLP